MVELHALFLVFFVFLRFLKNPWTEKITLTTDMDTVAMI